MRYFLISLLGLSAFVSPAIAADLSITVRGPDGRPVSDAVVQVKSAGGVPGTHAVRFNWPMVMNQQQIAFNPYVLLVPVGSEVTFPNRDKVRHHVYSFSTVKKFEIKLYGREETRRVVFDKPGVVPLGCNIHDQMIGFIYVTDTIYAAKTNASGDAVIRGLPNGKATLTLWHPDLRAPRNIQTQAVNIAGDQRLNIPAPLRAVSVRAAASGHQH